MLNLVNQKNIILWQQGKWQEKGIKAYFTTKSGLGYGGRYDTLNLGINTADTQEQVIENYKKLCKAYGLDYEYLIMTNQIHGDSIQEVIDVEKNNKPIFSHRYPNKDGFYTKISGPILVTHYADCVPVFIVDVKQKIVGVCHSGWKGTVKQISRKMIESYCEQEGSRLEDIEVWIGPHIGREAFEVGEEVLLEFKSVFNRADQFITLGENGKGYIDLGKCIELDLMALGLPEANIYTMEECTVADSEKYYSYRRDQGDTGRMAAIITVE